MKLSSTWPGTPEELERARTGYDRFDEFAARYRNDASLRARLDDGASDSLAEIGIDLPDGVEARIVADTPETMHFVMPPDPNSHLSDETLAAVAGGKTAGSMGSVGTAACMLPSSAPSTFSSAGSAGTIGSAGPAASPD